MALPFHPLISSWFTETYGTPTPVQAEAWPLIADGKDILAIAPTGSGKTLTAFLYALSRFIDGSWNPAELCVVYVSPLKALNEDIRRNLIEPIEALQQRAAAKGPIYGDNPVFRVRAETRSGDTPQAERRRFLAKPPSILAVTPESLAILLLNPKGREILSFVKYLVLDEIHAVMGTRRGAFLSCQIDRLSRITGARGSGGYSPNSGDSERPFQRAALSATINPPERAAAFAAGLDSNGKRTPLSIVAPRAEKNIAFSVEFPPPPEHSAAAISDRYGPRYAALVHVIHERIRALRGKNNTGTLLVFTDSKRKAERITFLLNESAGERIALCHHGALSKDVRLDVEQHLVRGRIPCVVATSSLELGLDIGRIDEVILAGTPASCAQALQRVGRSGHGVGETSRGVLIPFHGADLLMGAVMAGAAAEREIEQTKPIRNPLDILSQTILALCTEEVFTPDSLYAILRKFNVFSDLSRASFDRVLAMLLGNYFPEARERGGSNSVHRSAGERLRELKPRLYRDTDETLHPAEGTLALLYSSGGVIPSRGLYSMRLPDGTKIGELDEEFVFERRTGDSFDFGARSWKVVDIGSEAVTVEPLAGAADYQPFWKAEAVFRSPLLCRRTLDFFDHWNSKAALPKKELLGKEAAEALEDLLSRQKKAQGGIPLPNHNIIPVEIIDDPAVRPDAFQIVFHSFRGGALNYPLAMALSALLEEQSGIRCEAVPDDNAVLLQLPRLAAASVRGDPEALVKACIAPLALHGERYFKKRLEASGIFGAAFREAAECSLILPRGMFGKRIPLWVMRQRAKRLFDRAAAYGDFPLITEAWRSCLSDQFNMEAFRALLDDLVSGAVQLRFFRTFAATPFARNLSWKETNSFMYEYDTRSDILGIPARGGSGTALGGSLADKAIDDALGDPSLRPRIPAKVHEAFTARERRELSGYAPEDARSLAQWVKDRVLIPCNDEWETLRAALGEDLRAELINDPSLGGRLSLITFSGSSTSLVVHAERKADLETRSAAALLSCLAQWLRFEGMIHPARVAEIFGCTPEEAEDALNALVEEGDAVNNCTLENSENTLYCDRENYELLLRLTRKKARPEIKERPASMLVPFIAFRQGLIQKEADEGESALEQITRALSCYPAPVKLWETEIFPARVPAYKPEILDALLEEGRLIWFGAGAERAAFSPPEEFDLAAAVYAANNSTGGHKAASHELASAVAKCCSVSRGFWEIKDALEHQTTQSCSNAELAAAIWEAVWQGELSSENWESIRRGIEQGFIPEKHAAAELIRSANLKLPGIAPPYLPLGRNARRRIPGALKHKWREGSPVSGRWYSLETEMSFYEDETAAEDFSAIEREELNMERARLLLRRWGILCRPLLETESLFSWSELLPAMRRMELAGELVTGRFFTGIPSLQFASPQIVHELEEAESAANALYWMNAADPASPSGWNIEGLDHRLPARTSPSRLYFCGKELCAVSQKNGRELELFTGDDDPDLKNILPFLSVPRKRAVHPVKKITLEMINGKPAAESPYAALLLELGFIADRGKLLLW